MSVGGVGVPGVPGVGVGVGGAGFGGGVGGLTTALGMLKAGFDVTLYEKTGKFARFGGPIQFASNALSTLKAQLATAVAQSGVAAGAGDSGPLHSSSSGNERTTNNDLQGLLERARQWKASRE